MSSPPEKRPVVLVVEASSVSDALKASLGEDSAEVHLSVHPAQARIAAGSKRPAVLVVPTPGGDSQLAKSLRGVLPSSTRILGLVGDGDPLEPPDGVDRVVPLGDAQAACAAVTALLGEAASAAERGASLASFAEGQGEGGSVPSGSPPGKASPSEEDDADVDPARVAAIRDLAMSIQMARSMGGAAGGAGDVAAPSQGLGISLSAPGRDDPSQVDISVGSVSEALADLPDPSEAVTRTERLQALTAEREAARAAAEEAAKDRQAQAVALAQIRTHPGSRVSTQAIELAFVQRRRRGRVVKLIVALVLLAGAGVGGGAYWKHRQDEKRRSYKPPPPETFDDTLVTRASEARKHGLWVDSFAGLIARTPVGVRASDVDYSDEQLHRSVPELDRWFEQALRRLPARKVREQLLGRAEPLVRFDDLKRAEGYLDRALAIRDGADVRALLATVREKGGNPEKAGSHLRRALKLAPKRHDLRLRLGLVLLKAGKAEEGCAELKRAAGKLKEARAAHQSKCPKTGGAP